MQYSPNLFHNLMTSNKILNVGQTKISTPDLKGKKSGFADILKDLFAQMFNKIGTGSNNQIVLVSAMKMKGVKNESGEKETEKIVDLRIKRSDENNNGDESQNLGFHILKLGNKQHLIGNALNIDNKGKILSRKKIKEVSNVKSLNSKSDVLPKIAERKENSNKEGIKPLKNGLQINITRELAGEKSDITLSVNLKNKEGLRKGITGSLDEQNEITSIQSSGTNGTQGVKNKTFKSDVIENNEQKTILSAELEDKDNIKMVKGRKTKLDVLKTGLQKDMTKPLDKSESNVTIISDIESEDDNIQKVGSEKIKTDILGTGLKNKLNKLSDSISEQKSEDASKVNFQKTSTLNTLNPGAKVEKQEQIFIESKKSTAEQKNFGLLRHDRASDSELTQFSEVKSISTQGNTFQSKGEEQGFSQSKQQLMGEEGIKNSALKGSSGDKTATVIPLQNQSTPISGAELTSTAMKSNMEVSSSFRDTIIDQVVPSMTRMVREGISKVRIELKPKEMGTLKIELISEKSVLEAKFVVESEEVRNVIEKSLPELKNTLAKQGIQIENFDVNINREFSSFNGEENKFEGGEKQDNDSSKKFLKEREFKETEERTGVVPLYFGYNTVEYLV